MAPEPLSKWVVAGFVLMLAVIAGAVVWAGRSQYEDRLTAVRSVRAIEDGRAVEAVVQTNSCGEPRHLVVEESSTEVAVMALVRQETNGDCEDAGIQHTLRAELSDDLAGRELITRRPSGPAGPGEDGRQAARSPASAPPQAAPA